MKDIETLGPARPYEEIEQLRAERDSLRKNLDDRFAADKRAAKAIFAATGRKWAFPDNKEVVAYYVAEVERLEKESGGWKQLYETEKESAEAVDLDNITLRAKIERAKEALNKYTAARLRNALGEPAGWRISGKDSVNEAEIFARTVLFELSADAPAQQTQRDVITRDKDIILQALAEYDAWMLDDDYDATTALHKIMKRMRDRALVETAQQTQISGEAVEAGAKAAFCTMKSIMHDHDDHWKAERQLRGSVWIDVARAAITAAIEWRK